MMMGNPVKRPTRPAAPRDRRRLLLFKLQRAPTALRAEEGDFEHYFARGLGVAVEELRVVETVRGEEAPPPGEVAGAIFSGSDAMVTEPTAWMEKLRQWVRTALRERVPLLGVCFGHQLLAQTLGGRVDWNPGGPGFGSEQLTLSEAGRADSLFAEVAPRPLFQLWHQQAVTRMPPEAVLLAGNARVSVQSFRWRDQVWGTQFHPEFTPAVVRGYTRELSAKLPKLGTDPKALLDRLEDSPAGPRVLGNFAAHALGETRSHDDEAQAGK